MGPSLPNPRTVGRYLVSEPIAVGGMASVHFGLLNGPAGFRRTVAIKRMLQSWTSSPDARAMLMDEARLASRISHANVVPTLDVVEDGGELFLVLEYVHGVSLDALLDRAKDLGQPVAPRIATAIVAGALRGLHAAHEARAEDGQPLELVHRDLSPHNVMVDVNGVARVLDFGVARARGRLQGTRDGQLKGKLAYLAPEQVHGESSRRSDLFTAGVVLFECLAGHQLFAGESEADVLAKVLLCKVPTLASAGVDDPRLQRVLDRALAREPTERFSSAAEMAEALEACGAASPAELAAWLSSLAADTLADRARSVEALGRYTPAAAPPVERAGPHPRRPAELAVGIGVLALAIAAVAWTTARAPGSQAVAPPPAAREPLPTPAPAPAPSPPLDAAPAAEPAPPAAVPTRVAPKPGGEGAHRKSCDPPWVIDAQGVKRYKVECLK